MCLVGQNSTVLSMVNIGKSKSIRNQRVIYQGFLLSIKVDAKISFGRFVKVEV